MDVIVVNPQAKRLRQDVKIRDRIRRLFSTMAHIIDLHGRHLLIEELARISVKTRIERIFVVGGDGTFNDVLNWIVEQPTDTQPTLMSVGGGQFCYMTRFHKLPSKNPIKNLTQIFAGELKLSKGLWRPIRIHESVSGQIKFAAVVANGVVSDFQQWYEETGKGGFFKVLKLIFKASASVMSDWYRRKYGRIHLAKGSLILGKRPMKPKAYAGIVFSAIPELLASCRPFKGTPTQNEFYTFMYWGGLRRLAFSTPFIWFGFEPWWIKPCTFNKPIPNARVITPDARLLVDGDLFVWSPLSKNDRPERVLHFVAGPEIPLLFVTDL